MDRDDVRVVGTSLRADAIRAFVGNRERAFTRYALVHERANPADKNAIAVKIARTGELIGYLPCDIAAKRPDVRGAHGRLRLVVTRFGTPCAKVRLPLEKRCAHLPGFAPRADCAQE